ncbi:ArsR family transcriptional regulator [Methanocella paludicola SANAE]|uniref:ArsR family transcriptional regulator n=1 Tax=Methanocella paludicola (strain DSM 17711 / JCM 13418 / NBRC 101707 / SANAE) TaxID=304371 RepID=D1YW18_METPS|nr:ArsR family transcriptional regulator [Methanocella paludicola SANAE]
MTSLRNNIIECAGCGGFFDIEALKGEKDGSVRCPTCGEDLPLRIRPAPKAKDNSKKAQKEDFAETAQLFKCLGDPCRVKIIELLSDHELCVFEFVDMLGFQYSAVSYHLKMLKEMGIVQAYERGNFMVYSLTDKGETVHEFIERSRSLS